MKPKLEFVASILITLFLFSFCMIISSVLPCDNRPISVIDYGVIDETEPNLSDLSDISIYCNMPVVVTIP